MRIIAGKNKSRLLKTLDGLYTRPMMDKMKESVFNTIGPYFTDEIVLDLFGGSGALSLEALSRGAKFSYIVENNFNAIKVIEENINILKENTTTELIKTSYEKALSYFELKNIKFDLVFLDPPFKLNIIESILDYLFTKNLLNDNCILVCQYIKGNVSINNNYEIIKNNVYGTNELCIIRKK